MKKRLLLTLLATPMLTGCFASMSPRAPKDPTSLTATLIDVKEKYFTNEEYSITFSCSPREDNWAISIVLEDDSTTGFVYSPAKLHVDDTLKFHAKEPGTAKFHFNYNNKLDSNTIEMTFVDKIIDVETTDEFLNAIKNNSTDAINVKEDLDFTGVSFTAVPSFSGKIFGNDHTISNIDVLTTKKDDCVSLINNFSGTLEKLNFCNCNYSLVAECSRVGVFASTSSGTIREVNLDNIKMDSNLVSTMGSLIGYVEGGNYEDINATNLEIKGKKLVGGIFGDCTVIKETTLKDISASGKVELYYNTEDYLGGVSSVICNNTDKYKNGRITVTNVMADNIYVGQAYKNTGGVIGFARNCDITFTENLSNENTKVLGAYNVGGLYGAANNCTITKAVNHAEVYTGFNASKRDIAGLGGIVGNATNCDITNCKNYGLITSLSETAEPQGVGGIVGWANGNDSNHGNYYYLENYGSIEGENADGVAGIVGRLTANCNRTFGFMTVDVDYIRAKNCCGSIVGYVEINGTFSLNNSTYKYNECTYNKGHCSSKEQAEFEPAIGGFSYYNYGTASIQVNEVTDLNA